MDDARKVQLLWDKLAIDQLMLRFGRALDLHDWGAYRTCFVDEITIDFRDLTGQDPRKVTADAWTAFARAALEPVKCLHRYTNHFVTVKGDRAHSVLYMEACHFRPTARGGAENTQHGWYENDYVFTAGEWRISKLGQRIQWVTGNEGVLDLGTEAVQTAFRAAFAADS